MMEAHCMEKTITPTIIHAVAQAVPFLVAFPSTHFGVDYDKEADVLYISFDRPQKATDTEMTDDGILLRYRKKQLDASTRGEA